MKITIDLDSQKKKLKVADSDRDKYRVSISLQPVSQEIPADLTNLPSDISGLSCLESLGEIDELIRFDIDSQVQELNLPKKRERKLNEKRLLANPAHNPILNQFQRDLINISIAMRQNRKRKDN